MPRTPPLPLGGEGGGGGSSQFALLCPRHDPPDLPHKGEGSPRPLPGALWGRPLRSPVAGGRNGRWNCPHRAPLIPSRCLDGAQTGATATAMSEDIPFNRTLNLAPGVVDNVA